MLTLTKSLFALMIGFLLSTAFGLVAIPLLKKIKAGQRINIYVENHQKKSGTPTMGGIIFIIPTIITTIILLLTNKIEFSVNLLIVMFVFISYGLIGFLDDYISIKQNHNKGLSQSQKLFLQFIVALIFYILYRKYTDANSTLEITLLNIEWKLDWFYGVFILFLLVGSSNAVNLTDGLDGLAGGLSAISILAFGLISWGSYWIEGYQDIGIFCFILVGSIMGFLVYNTNPAKVFMGDTGSLTIGGIIAVFAIIIHKELLIPILCGIFLVENLSVILQVKYFQAGKKKGKKQRIFKRTPIHDHFRITAAQLDPECSYLFTKPANVFHESKITVRFWIITIILAAITIITLKIR